MKKRERKGELLLYLTPNKSYRKRGRGVMQEEEGRRKEGGSGKPRGIQWFNPPSFLHLTHSSKQLCKKEKGRKRWVDARGGGKGRSK